jgi:hypothetical protein
MFRTPIYPLKLLMENGDVPNFICHLNKEYLGKVPPKENFFSTLLDVHRVTLFARDGIHLSVISMVTAFSPGPFSSGLFLFPAVLGDLGTFLFRCFLMGFLWLLE